MSESLAASSGVAKKKFAAPPVKSACLTWPLPSPDHELKPLPGDVLAMLSQGPADVPRQPVPLSNYIDPGAGLKHLEDWFQDSDFMFDSLFMNTNGPVAGTDFSPDLYGTGTPTQAVPMVSLDAYYVFIHPYFPILPPPDHIPVDQPVPRLQNQFDVWEEGFEPSSPITLAISAILALIPCPEDVDHQSHDSRVFRRKYAQYFAQSAFETIEKDDDIPDSAVEPSKPLSEDHDHNFRKPFHPGLPVELESIVALDILSVYEYCQRGNLKKMQSRAGQALINAMDLGLHMSKVEDEFSEARRRVWWMTKPSFTVFAPTFTAKFPVVAADPDAFPVYIQCQRVILAATQFVIDLNQTVSKEGADMNPLYERMKDLDASMAPLLSLSETWILASTTTSPVDPTEDIVARSLRCMGKIKLNSARIKLHRYCAFFDIPVFSRKHCDLKSLNAAETGEEPKRWPTCSCSSFNNPFSVNTGGGGSSSGSSSDPQQSPSSDGYGNSSTGSVPVSTPSTTSDQATVSTQQSSSKGSTNISTTTTFPFSSHQSAKICLRSALRIAHSFDEMPYPNPSGAPPQPSGSGGRPAQCMLSPTSGTPCPRTMPSFACCAMQCAYALLMVHQKTTSVYPTSRGSMAGVGGPVGGGGGGGGAADRPMVVSSLLVRLQQGLTSIYLTLSNYASAFEALGGMREQIGSAIEDSTSFTLPM
ncbi:hypothetical protein VSDG_05056 [Cytospora chrysosperma]|uniref:Transcription factor domain-containing protein n=1 Tax=Cytospora chrysosperma TaxID=252740 RepID=A0A423VYB1_CYTCH|nr:hypothetical protein VSDG_05056 [Valsa sordida]